VSREVTFGAVHGHVPPTRQSALSRCGEESLTSIGCVRAILVLWGSALSSASERP